MSDLTETPLFSPLPAACAGAAALLVAPSVQGASLNLSGHLSLTLSALPTLNLPSNGSTTIFISSGAGSFSEPAGLFGPTTVALPKELFTGVPQISGLTLTNFGNGTKVFNGSLGTGTGGLLGSAIITVMQLVDLTIPLDVVGLPGTVVQAAAPAIQVEVIGQGWTTGLAVVTGVTTVTPGRAVVNTVSMQGSDVRTPGHQGTIVLVSGYPGHHERDRAPRRLRRVGLTFVPEPGTLVVLGSGALALVWYGRRRMHRR